MKGFGIVFYTTFMWKWERALTGRMIRSTENGVTGDQFSPNLMTFFKTFKIYTKVGAMISTLYQPPPNNTSLPTTVNHSATKKCG